MRSMTGFGMGHASLGAGRLCVELKSLNHRYLDIRVRVPAELSDHSFFLENLARGRLSRGRFDIQVRLEGAALAGPHLDVHRVRSVFRQLAQLRDELSPNSEISLTALAGLSNLYVDDSALDTDQIREAISTAFKSAVERLEAMREAEGESLQRTLRELLDKAIALTAQCEARCRDSIAAHRDRLRERVARLVDDSNLVVDPSRLEQEVTLIAERSDASEELARLGSHFSMFSQLIGEKVPTGRKLDFLLQEIARETNTLGAKSQDATLSHWVVELKAETERMREQVQNVE